MESLAMVAISIGALIMVLFPNFMVNLVGVVILAVGIGTANAACYKILPNFSNTPVAGVSGWVAGLGAFGGVLWPVLFGVIVSLTGKYHRLN